MQLGVMEILDEQGEEAVAENPEDCVDCMVGIPHDKCPST